MGYSKSEVKKDAKRFAKAKMDYGKGAGIKRRHVNAELEKKLQDASYRKAFEAELEKVNMDRVVQGVKTRHAVEGVHVNGKRVFKNVVKAGTIAAAGYTFYTNNKEGIDRIARGIKVKVQNAVNKRKYKEQIKPASMTDAEKAAAYLESVGIKVVK